MIKIKSISGRLLYEGDHPDLKTAVEAAVKTRTNLTGADLAGACLDDACLVGANLADASLVGADLACANLVGANLADANLRAAYLIRANLTSANLTSANLIRVNLAGANLTGAYLTGANFGNGLKARRIISITGLEWPVLIGSGDGDPWIKVGCQIYAVSTWKAMSDEEINKLWHGAADFRRRYGAVLEAMTITEEAS